MRASDIDISLINNAADVIVKYGFLGAGIVLALLIAPAAYKFWNSKPVALATFACGVAFIVAWGVLDIVQKNFPWLISSKRVLLSGVVLDVPNGFQVQVSSDIRKVGSAYLKRQVNQRNNATYDFPFLLLSSNAPGCLSVAISNNDPRSESGSSGFSIDPISTDDLKSDVALVAEAEQQGDAFRLRFWREAGDKQLGDAEIIRPLGNGDEGCHFGRIKKSVGWIASTAHAQVVNLKGLSIRLESDDLFTRRTARIELSKEGAHTFSIADQLLSTNNYRLQLGALVALSIMPDAQRAQMPPDLRAKVAQFTTNSDSTIRNAARRALQ